MYIFKVFKINEKQMIIQTPSDFCDNVSLPMGVGYVGNGYTVNSSRVGVPKRGILMLKVLEDYGVEKYVEELERRFQNNIDVEIQYSDISAELNGIDTITFVKRNVGIFTFTTVGMSDDVFESVSHGLCTLKNLNEGKLKIYNI